MAEYDIGLGVFGGPRTEVVVGVVVPYPVMDLYDGVLVVLLGEPDELRYGDEGGLTGVLGYFVLVGLALGVIMSAAGTCPRNTTSRYSPHSRGVCYWISRYAVGMGLHCIGCLYKGFPVCIG